MVAMHSLRQVPRLELVVAVKQFGRPRIRADALTHGESDDAGLFDSFFSTSY